MPVLHEIIAVFTDSAAKLKKIFEETKRVFTNNRELFVGEVKVTTAFNDADSQTYNKTERKEITSTVRERLAYSLEAAIEEADRSATIDATNCIAKADIVVDGKTLATAVPGVTLLGLERRFEAIKGLILDAPTLPAGIAWKQAPGERPHIMVTEFPKSTNITKPVSSVLTLAVATDKHQATTKEVVTDTAVAARVDTIYNGMLSPIEKSEMLERCGQLIEGIKAARMRANGATVVDLKVMKSLTDFLAV